MMTHITVNSSPSRCLPLLSHRLSPFLFLPSPHPLARTVVHPYCFLFLSAPPSFPYHHQCISSHIIFTTDTQAELVAIDEAAAIPLPTVKKLMGPYLVFMSSTGRLPPLLFHILFYFLSPPLLLIPFPFPSLLLIPSIKLSFPVPSCAY